MGQKRLTGARFAGKQERLPDHEGDIYSVDESQCPGNTAVGSRNPLFGRRVGLSVGASFCILSPLNSGFFMPVWLF